MNQVECAAGTANGPGRSAAVTPVGDPAPNAPKWFAAVEMIRLAADKDWLHKATKEISKYWRNKRERRLNLPSYAGGAR